MSEQQSSPWAPPKQDDSPFINYGVVDATIETRKSRNKYYLVRLNASPLNGDFEIKRTAVSFSHEYAHILLPSLQDIVMGNKFMDFPIPSEEPGVTPRWEFYARWEMAPFKDYSDNSIEFFENSDKPERVLTNDEGRKYVEKTTFKFLDAYPNQAACMVAMEKEFPQVKKKDDDIPGFDAPDKPEPDAAKTAVDAPGSPDMSAILPMMLNGVWDAKMGEFTGLEEALIATGTSLGDRATRIVIYAFLEEKSLFDNLDIGPLRENYSAKFGEIDSDEWKEANPVF